MAITAALSDRDFQAQAYYLDWAEHHPDGPLQDSQLAYGIDNAGSAYSLTNAEVRIDFSAGRNTVVSRCTPGPFGGNLLARESVLLSDNVMNRLPVLLSFPKPLRSVGARVSGSATTANVPYWAHCHVLLSDRRWYPVPPRQSVLTTDGSGPVAPFMGATADPGRTIRAIGFDIMDMSTPSGPGGSTGGNFLQVAIGNLFYAL